MKIGWIGLGAMGLPMAEKVLDQGSEVFVYNRTTSEAVSLVEKGAQLASSPQELLQSVDLVVSILSDMEANQQVFSDPALAAGQGKIWLNMSTISPNQSHELAQRADSYGLSYLEAPVSGSVGAAQAGRLLSLLAGNQAQVQVVEPILRSFSAQIFYLGELGRGTASKLVMNSLLASMGQAYAESFLLAEDLGLDKGVLSQIIAGSGMNSPLFQAKQTMLVQEVYPPAFMFKHMTKDLFLAKERVPQLEQLPLLEAVTASYQTALEAGLGEQDMIAIQQYLKEKRK